MSRVCQIVTFWGECVCHSSVPAAVASVVADGWPRAAIAGPVAGAHLGAEFPAGMLALGRDSVITGTCRGAFRRGSTSQGSIFCIHVHVHHADTYAPLLRSGYSCQA